MPDRIVLTLAHSPDPDDVFMWWPLTGKIDARRSREAAERGEAVWQGHSASLSKPVIDAGRFEFRAMPLDIEVLNRRASERGDLEITALSARAWSDLRERYVITSCGASFGDGFGPKVVVRDDDARFGAIADAAKAGVRFAIPGRRTTAFLMLGMLLGDRVVREPESFIEMPFDHIISAVEGGDVDAGLVIHEGQLTFTDAGLRLLADVGAWWKRKTGLKLPLGVNAIRRDLESIHGPGTVAEVARLLRASVDYTMARREESVAYSMPFAIENVRRGGGEEPTLERVERYCRMYVSDETRDMGDAGREAIRRLLSEGAKAGLCDAIDRVETV
jgi:1,4-dihydroxy-6-naphthoate synthase